MLAVAAILTVGGGLMTNLAPTSNGELAGLAALLVGLCTLLIWAALGVIAALTGTL